MEQSQRNTYTSVLFSKVEANETLQVSSEAHTPLWLTKKTYSKIHVKTERKRHKEELAHDMTAEFFENYNP